MTDFPFDMPAKNAASVHPRILRAVSQLLDTVDIRLSECQVWCKYGAYLESNGDYSPQPSIEEGQSAESVHEIGDQSHHLDYGNGTLVVPVVESFREEVACAPTACPGGFWAALGSVWLRTVAHRLIMYLGTVEETGGATAVVSRELNDDTSAVQSSVIRSDGFGSRGASPEMYGSLL